VVVSFLMSTYYSVIIGYSIYYFFTSFKTEMPWIDCNNRWVLYISYYFMVPSYMDFHT